MARTKGTKEWADTNVNFLYGCRNDCVYCYAKKMAYRFGRISSLDEWKEMKLNKKAIDKKYGRRNGRIMFPSSHDLFPEHLPFIKQILSKIINAKNNVLITTKPRFPVIKYICDEFYEKKKFVQFRFTITSLDNRILYENEPGAPFFEERIASLVYAFNKRFKTSVSIEPFLDKNPEPLINRLYPFVSESIWIGPENHCPKREIYSRENLMKIYDLNKKYEKVRFKDAFLNKMRGM